MLTGKHSKKTLILALGAFLGFLPVVTLSAAKPSPLMLTSEEGPAATIVVDADAPELTRTAAQKLVHYVREISGVTLPVAHRSEEVRTGSIIWIGPHDELANRHPKLDLSVTQPEASLIETDGKDLIILGRDKVTADGTMMEAGTHLAVTSFIEEQLGVRWLWPGKLGTDIPKSRVIQVEPISVRYTPQLHLRRINMSNFLRSYETAGSGKSKFAKEFKSELAQHVANPAKWAKENDRLTRDWLNNHRSDAPPTGFKVNAIAGPLGDYRNRHAFADWYHRYGARHPDWFALQPDGTRTPYPKPRDVKMCVSNPEVAEQWVKNAKAFFEANPNANTFEAAENDFGWQGYCVCENCLAMDNPDAEELERELRWKNTSRRSYALTDRYARFWNTIARKLKEEFPDRDVNVTTYAYHATRPAPTVPLEPNIIPTFVGIERRFYQRNSQAHTLDQRRLWQGWWEALGKRNALIWRPNLMARSMGFPYLFTQRHAENMHFMADHGLLGVTFNSTHSYWAIEGPQLYLMVKLLWKPRADAQEILDDYYQRAFGPAAPHMKNYFLVYEDLYTRLAEEYGEYGFSILADPPRLFREIRPDDEKPTARLGHEGVTPHRNIENKAAAYLEQATAAVATGDPIYRDRVEFMKVGFVYTQAQLDCIEAMNHFNKKASSENRERAEEAAARRLSILRENADSLALNYINALILIDKHSKYLGPPQKEESGVEREKEETTLMQDLEA